MPSGAPAEGVGGGAEAAGEEDCRGGEDEATGERRGEKGCGRSGKTGEPAYVIQVIITVYQMDKCS